MTFDLETLVAYQRAELGKAEKLRVWLLLVQLLAVMPAVISVFFEAPQQLYYLALLSAVFLLVWTLLYQAYHMRRTAGESARRASYVVGGLGQSLTREEVLRLLEKLRTSETELNKARNKKYFQTDVAPSPRRVAEMLTESVFYSKQIQAACAKLTLVWFAFVMTAFVGIAVATLPVTDITFQVTSVRVFLAVLMFMFSYDVFGAIHGHIVAWIELKGILTKLEMTAVRSHPQTEVLMLVGDYCSTMERAPLSLPYVYRWQVERLGKAWETYRSVAAS